MSNDNTPDINEATISWDASRVVFTQTPDWILNNTDINDAAFRTWMAIASFASNKSHKAFPSARKLMEMRGKGRRIIFEHIRQLEAAGLLARQARFRPNGGRTSSHYTLAWSQPLAPMQETAPGGSAEVCATPDAAKRAESRAEKRAPRTRTTPELDPLPPQPTLPTDPSESRQPQGASAPRTPQSSRQGRRKDGNNPRALEAKTSKGLQMRQWARNMHGALDHDEFVEHVESEVQAAKITVEQGRIAIDESARLAGLTEPSATS